MLQRVKHVYVHVTKNVSKLCVCLPQLRQQYRYVLGKGKIACSGGRRLENMRFKIKIIFCPSGRRLEDKKLFKF